MGDYTRDTRAQAIVHSTRARYLQQGRQLLDADWNAQAGLTAARAEDALTSTVGRQGVPREDAGFAITGGSDTLTIGAGTCYVEGLRCHNPEPVGYAGQVSSDILPALGEAIPDGAEGLVHLEALTRALMEAEDLMLPEPALDGADTVVHEVISWSVHVTALADTGISRSQLIDRVERNAPAAIPAWGRTTGGLDADVQTEEETTDPGPCEMPATAGYLDQVNRLFRIQIRDSGVPGAATFTWTADSAAEAGLRSQGSGFVVDLSPQRAAQLFPKDAVVEVLTSDRQRVGVAGPIGTITSDPGAPLTIDGVAAAELDPTARLRRWDTLPQTVPAGSGWAPLSLGLKIRFAPGEYEYGSAWTVPARARTGDILWPPHPFADLTLPPAGEGEVGFYAPDEGHRRRAPLAIVRRVGSSYSVTHDLRQVFDPLTDLTAQRVRYDNDSSGLTASDVQGAIDELARNRGDHCTYSAHPGPGWESVFDLIPANGNATICLPVGNYPLSSPVEISGKGHVRIIGAGRGSKVWCHGDTTALRLRGCRSVEVADLTVAAENRSPWKPRAGTSTTGAIDLRECGSVRIERATLITGGTKWRQATCLRIDAGGGAHHGGGDVMVRDCDLVAGDLAGGVLVLDATTARITDNRIRPRAEEHGRTVKRWADDPMASASLGRILFSNAQTGRTLSRPRTRATSAFREQTITVVDASSPITFLTFERIPPTVWQAFATAYASRANRQSDSRLLRLDIRELTGNLWANGGVVRAEGVEFTGFRPIHDALIQAITPVIDSGIVVAGSFAGDVTVAGNSIEGALHGVRVAISDPALGRLAMRSVRVSGNTIRLPSLPLDRPVHGIHVGSAARVWVVDNDIARDVPGGPGQPGARLRLQDLFAEGVRVFGELGPMVQMRGNVIADCSDGITVWSYTVPEQRLRLLDGNMIVNASTPWRVRGGATRVNNTPA